MHLPSENGEGTDMTIEAVDGQHSARLYLHKRRSAEPSSLPKMTLGLFYFP